MNRIDREIVKRNMKFVNNSLIHEKEIIRKLFTENNLEDIENQKYKPINYYNLLHEQNKLYENNLLLLFNRKKKEPNELVYTVEQNIE